MTQEQRDSIAHALITTKFSSGQSIVNEGDRADSYYVIKSGQVSVWKGKEMLRKMGPKDSFGEQALYVSSVRGATVKADDEVKCVALGRENLSKILGDKVQIIVFNNLMRWSFGKSQILSQLTKIQLEKIAQNAKTNNYKQGAMIYVKGEICEKLVIVLEGTLSSGQESYNKGQAFGDAFIRTEKRHIPMPNDYVMQTDGVLAVLSFNQLFKAIGGDFETVIIKNENSHEKKIQQLGQRADASHIKVEDLIFIKKLGQGQFGWVYLVQHKDQTDKAYALKSVSKASIIEQNLEKHIIQEKTVLEMINFPFIMQFVRTFKDEISVYFLVEYIKGLELFDVIRDIGLLSKSDTQFYIGTMILCLEYLHSKTIVYRDLKPENIMINEKGYMYLIDLGTAKPLTKQSNMRTFTIIGTPHYMAPEILLGKGYSFNVDLWSTGVCMYEFMCGGVPYAEDAEDPYEIYEEIINTQLKYPSFLKDRVAKKFIDQLLQKGPEARLGGSYASLKAHTWFDDFDWDKLFSKDLHPPYKPPNDRLISDQEFQKSFKIGKGVVNEIKMEQAAQKIKIRKPPKNENWDKDF